jgi:hypothetical protein
LPQPAAHRKGPAHGHEGSSGLSPWRTAVILYAATGFCFIFVRMWWRWLKQRDTWAWIAIAVVMRGGFFNVFLHEDGLHGAWYGWGAETGDTAGYFEPMDSFLAGNAYRPDFRMPGYGLPYLLLRLCTTPQGAGTAIVFLQCLLGMVGVVVLARCARLLRAPRWAQYLTCILFAVMPRMALYDVYWFTESFCTSAMIIATHGWLAHHRTGSRWALLWGGAWMAWAVFLRPVQFVWLFLLVAGLLMTLRGNWRERGIAAALFLLPFVLSDGWWLRRNQVMHHEFAPFSRGTVIPELAGSPMYPLMRFLQATGGNYIHWDPSAHIRWFNMREGPLGRPGPRIDKDVVMPAFALCESITEDSLRAWANDMSRYSDGLTTVEERAALFRSMSARSDRYVRHYAHERPWQHVVASRIRLTGLLFNRAGSGPLFHTPPIFPGWFCKPIAAVDAPVHWAVLCGGLVAGLFALVNWRQERIHAWLGAMVLISVFMVPWVLRMCEGRYTVPMYPWLVLSLTIAASRIAAARSRTAAS